VADVRKVQGGWLVKVPVAAENQYLHYSRSLLTLCLCALPLLNCEIVIQRFN